jgi:hypothetical protein
MVEVEELRRKQKEIKVEEEVKEGKDKKGPVAGIQKVLPCFDFYNNLESLNSSDI